MNDTKKLKTLQDLIRQKRECELRKKNFTKEISSKIDLASKEIEKIIMGEDEAEGQMDIDDYIDKKAE